MLRLGIRIMGIIHELGPGGRGGRSTRVLSAAAHINISGTSVLDLGCKEGYNSFDLCDLGARKVLGVEARDLFVQEALDEKAHGSYAQADFILGDARQSMKRDWGCLTSVFAAACSTTCKTRWIYSPASAKSANASCLKYT